MCDFNQGFVLCTCARQPARNSAPPRSAEASAAATYHWTLCRYRGPSTVDVMGSYLPRPAPLGQA
jgi:hypothetical protein